MSNSQAPSESANRERAQIFTKEEWYLWIPVFGALAYMLWDLMYWWGRMEDYNFGYIVPLFSAYLIYENWQVITAKKTPDRRWYLPAWIFAGLCFLIVANYKALIGHDQTPSWILAIGAMSVFSAAIVATWGWRAFRICLFPILFIFVAVPLPQSIWGGISQTLQRFVAFTSVEILTLFGIPVIQHGNTLELETGKLAVADACSGIRSLQMSIMIGLLLGKLFLRTYFTRFLLVLVGMMIAIPGNLFRTIWLTVTAHFDGLEAMQALHDPAGWIVMGSTVVGVGFVCFLLYKFEGIMIVNPLPQKRTASNQPRQQVSSGAGSPMSTA